MKNSVTVKEAIKKGKWQLVFMPMFILIGCISLVTYLVASELAVPWIVGVGIAGGFILAWLYWSANVMKWKVWAFESVRNVHELKRKAIMSKLIWEDGSFFEKTAFISHDQKQQWHQLQKKFLEKDVYHDDISVPKSTSIKYSKSFIVLGICISLGIVGTSIYFAFWKDSYWALLGLLLAGFFMYQELKKLMTSTVPILIDGNGIILHDGDLISWKNIQDDYILVQQQGKQTRQYLSFLEFGHKQHLIDISQLDTDVDKLENLLRVYRVRFEKFNT